MPQGLLRSLSGRAAACLLGLGLAAIAGAANAAGPAGTAATPDPAPPDEGRLLYRPVADVRVLGAGGGTFRLSERWRERPLLVVMVFAGCAEICPPFLSSLRQAVAEVGGAGQSYEVVVVSFDPRDGPADMARVAERHGLAGARGWRFGVTSPAEARLLARSIGFWYRSEAGRFDHPAMLAAVDSGRVVRLLVGADVPPRRLREVVAEAGRRFVATYPLPGVKVLFRCFGYDPRRGGMAPDWGLLLLLLPAAVMVSATAWIFRRPPP